MIWLKHPGFHTALLLAVMAVFEWSNIDLYVQDQFYLWDLNRWIIDKHEPVLRFLFYIGPKIFLVTLGIVSFALIFASFRWRKYRPYRRSCLLLGFSLVFVPLSISGLKTVSHVHTPNSIIRYGGAVPYCKVFQKYPRDYTPKKPGRGWPAGHASGGFALMMLYFVFQNKTNRILGLLAGLTIGWTMGMYQTLNGQHYLSHTIIAMQLSWLIILLLHTLVEYLEHHGILRFPLETNEPILKKYAESF